MPEEFSFIAMRTQQAQGFTLFEFILVLILTAILSAVVIEKWPGSSINITAQADRLISDIRYVQSLSMTRGQRYRINFTATSYSITDAAGTTPVPHPMNNATSVALNSDITLTTTHGFLVFDGNGAPYTTATLPGTALASDAVITLTTNGATRTIRISPQTGRVLQQ